MAQGVDPADIEVEDGAKLLAEKAAKLACMALARKVR